MLKPDIDSLVPHVPFNRRTFIKAALGTGFAAAVLPVSAQTIHTDSDGLEAGEVAVHSGDTLVPAYRAQPKGKTHLPVIIVCTRPLACTSISPMSAGASPSWVIWRSRPNLLRAGGRSVGAADYPAARRATRSARCPTTQVMDDLDATVAWAGEHGGDLNRLGVNGFCWGGRIAWLYAEHNPQLKAVVAWYGRVTGAENALTTQPIRSIRWRICMRRCWAYTGSRIKASRRTRLSR